MENAFAHPIDEVVANFGADANTGLTANQVADLRKKHGRNGTPAVLPPVPRDAYTESHP
jgi:Ca2+ transporting ATPase